MENYGRKIIDYIFGKRSNSSAVSYEREQKIQANSDRSDIRVFETDLFHCYYFHILCFIGSTNSDAKLMCVCRKTMKMNNCGSAFLGFADRLARKIKKIIRGSLMSC